MQRVIDRLRALVAIGDPNGTVTLGWIADLLDEVEVPNVPGEDEIVTDLTFADIARLVNRDPSTVHGWHKSGKLKAYKFGREWRVTRAEFKRFIDSFRNGTSGTAERASREKSAVDLGGWRRYVRAEK